MMYKLSIIIPVYNAEQYIDDCLDSIIQELNTETEILLMDDGSKDSSLEKCRKYERTNIRVFHHDNHGVSYTRNRGISESAGKYVMFVDSDDVLMQGWQEFVFSVIDKDLDIIYFSGKLDQKDENKKAIAEGIFGIRKEHSLTTMASPCSKIFNKNFLNINSIVFDSNLINGEDALFNLEAAIKCGSFEFVTRSLYQYRIHNTSSTKTFNPQFYKSNLLFLQKAEKLMSESGQFGKSEIDYTINFSFSYSVYLYLFLISRIRDRNARAHEMKKIHSKAMKQYFQRFPVTVHPDRIVQITYRLIERHKDNQALLFTDFLNLIRNVRNRFRSGKNEYYFLEM